MVKFKVLKYHGSFFLQLGIFENDFAPVTGCDKSRKLAIYSHNLFVSMAFATSCVLFVSENFNDNLSAALRTSVFLLATVQSMSMFASFHRAAETIQSVHFELQDVVDKSTTDDENDASHLYWATEVKCRELTKRVLVFLCVEMSTILAMLIAALVDIAMGRADDTSKWILPIELVAPVNTELIFGWILNWFYQFDMCLIYLVHMITTTTHFACSCHYIMTMCAHFDQMMAAIRDESQKACSTENIQEQRMIWINAEQKLQHAIQLHIRIYEIFDLVANINSGVIFFLLPANVVLLALTMYTMENTEFQTVGIFAMDLICQSAGMMWPYLFCHFANLTTDRVLANRNVVYDLNWIDYPVRMRKYIILLIARSQQPIIFSGLFLFPCSLEVFGLLFKKSCSYYMIFRNLR